MPTSLYWTQRTLLKGHTAQGKHIYNLKMIFTIRLQPKIVLCVGIVHIVTIYLTPISIPKLLITLFFALEICCQAQIQLASPVLVELSLALSLIITTPTHPPPPTHLEK